MNTDRIGRPEARRLAEEEFQCFAELTAALTPGQWAMPTDCTAWDVRKIGLHVLGPAEAQARDVWWPAVSRAAACSATRCPSDPTEP
jgi:Mycothiol maleylpyruvate isomerase N-terminal domain